MVKKGFIHFVKISTSSNFEVNIADSVSIRQNFNPIQVIFYLTYTFPISIYSCQYIICII